MRGGAVLGASLALVLVAAPAAGELRVTDLLVYLNDYDVTVQMVVSGTVPQTFIEGLQGGVPAHVRFTVELWHARRMWPDRRLVTRTIERQLQYDVLTKEFKVVSMNGEARDPYSTRDLRDAQRVLSELRGVKLTPVSQLDPSALFYIRVRAETALKGENTFLTRIYGESEETEWISSSLLTVTRTE
jgi:hypothetical protein